MSASDEYARGWAAARFEAVDGLALHRHPTAATEWERGWNDYVEWAETHGLIEAILLSAGAEAPHTPTEAE